MPNWTDCKLEINGKPAKLKEFKAKASSYKSIDDNSEIDYPVISCQAFIPCPQDLTDTMAGSYGINDPKQTELVAKEKANIEKYGYKNWYDWEKDNWGVKWGLCDPELKDDQAEDGYLTYAFKTPWTYPEKWLALVSKEWPDLVFDLYFVGEGYEFCGRITYKKGECTHQTGN